MIKRIFTGVCALLVSFLSVSAKNGTALSSSDDNYLNAIKITFLSWASGSTKLSYERAFPKHHQSAEFCASLISAGYDKYHNDPLGFTLRYGHKFFLAGNDEFALRGFYVRPEAILSRYYYNCAGVSGARRLANMGALLATTGYQLTLRRFLLDAWVGAGYAFGTPAETYYHHGFQCWNYFGKRNPNIALSFSIRVGICF